MSLLSTHGKEEGMLDDMAGRFKGCEPPFVSFSWITPAACE